MLKFIGCGSAFNTKLGNNAAVLEAAGQLLLMDCGSTTFSRLQGAGFLQPDRLKGVHVLLTHLHPDHAGSVGDLIFYVAHKTGRRPVLHHPRPDHLRQLLTLQGVRESYYELESEMAFQLSFVTDSEDEVSGAASLGLNIEWVIQPHSETLPAFGFFLTLTGSTPYRIFYSGDSYALNPLAYEKLIAGELDYYYQDTCSYKLEGAGHMYLGDLALAVSEGLRQKVVCMHLDEDFSVKAAVDLGFSVVEPVF